MSNGSLLFFSKECLLIADFVCNLNLLFAVFLNNSLPVEHKFRHLFSAWIFGHVLQVNALFLVVIANVGLLLFPGPTLLRPAWRFLLYFELRVHVVSKQPHPSVFFPEMPYFMNF